MMAEEPQLFKEKVQASLRRQVAAINKLTEKGMYFFDYGNAFLLESSRAGADILKEDGRFRYPSYVQDIMGPMFFDYGFGPFRWVCSSCDPKDLETSDRIATAVLEEIRKTATPDILGQLDDNIHWIKEAGRNQRFHVLLFSAATIMMCQAQILLSVRLPTFTTDPSSVLTWLYRTSLATLSVGQHGCQSITVAVLVGEKSSTVALVW